MGRNGGVNRRRGPLTAEESQPSARLLPYSSLRYAALDKGYTNPSLPEEMTCDREENIIDPLTIQERLSPNNEIRPISLNSGHTPVNIRDLLHNKICLLMVSDLKPILNKSSGDRPIDCMWAGMGCGSPRFSWPIHAEPQTRNIANA